MLRKTAAVMLFALLTAAVAGCSNGNSSENTPTAMVSPSPTGATTPEVQPTGEVTPGEGVSPTVTTSPTQAVTPTQAVPTKAPEIGSAEWIARNRELHEIAGTAKDVSPVGTGNGKKAEKNPLTEVNISYGISRVFSLSIDGVEIEDNAYKPSGANEGSRLASIRISGLRDQAVADKIHARVDEVVRTMGDPGYIPNVQGIVQLLRQYGPVASSVACDALHYGNGYLTVVVYASWRIGDSTYVERNRLTFNLATGEELRLSDLFPEGEDYIDLITKAANDPENNGNPFEGNFWFFDDEYRRGEIIGDWTTYDETREYDGGRVKKSYQSTGTDFFDVATSNVTGELRCRIDADSSEFYVKAGCDPAHTVKSNEEIYAEKEHFSAGALGYRYFAYSSDRDFDEMAKEQKKAENIVIPANSGKKTVKILGCTVNPEDDWAVYESNEKTVEEYSLTEEQVFGAIKQRLQQGVPEDLYGSKYWIFPTNLDVYPNGYGKLNIRWLNPDEAYSSLYTESFWIKDGAYVSDEEMFDVSYEEFFTDIWAETGVMSDEDCAAVAKIFAENVVRIHWDEDYFLGYFKFSDMEFTFGSAYEDNAAAVSFIDQLSPYMPQDMIDDLWNTLNWQDSTERFGGLPFFRHLRMYEGYPFN